MVNITIEIEETRLEYNDKQTKNDRKINDYFIQISNDNNRGKSNDF